MQDAAVRFVELSSEDVQRRPWSKCPGGSLGTRVFLAKLLLGPRPVVVYAKASQRDRVGHEAPDRVTVLIHGKAIAIGEMVSAFAANGPRRVDDALDVSVGHGI